jgi:hypothetical protein
VWLRSLGYLHHRVQPLLDVPHSLQRQRAQGGDNGTREGEHKAATNELVAENFPLHYLPQLIEHACSSVSTPAPDASISVIAAPSPAVLRVIVL